MHWRRHVHRSIKKLSHTWRSAGLEQHSLSLADAVFVHLYLADMGSFAAANRAYSRHFPAVSPAARACIQTPLPQGVPLAVDVLFRPGLPSRTTTGL